MAEITRDTCVAEVDAVMEKILTADTLRAEMGDEEFFVEAVQAALDHPCAFHEIAVGELHGELAEVHRSLGRYDEAIAAWESAISAGLRSQPHPRAHVAQVLAEAGRLAEAEALYARLHADHPIDAWLCWNAATVYGEIVDDPDASLRWVDRGIDIALATGDPGDVLFELLETRSDLLHGRGLEVDHDDLGTRAVAFTPPATPLHPETDYGDAPPPVPESCDHCGWSQAEEPVTRISLWDLRNMRAALRRSR